MGEGNTISVKLLSFLYTYMSERGLATDYAIEVPAQGRPCLEIARDLNLPLELIEAVFINGKAHGLDAPCRPGDRVVFIPTGMPGPYRVLLGIRSNDPKNP